MFLIFDIGATKTRVAVSDDGKTVNKPYVFDTPQSFEDGITLFSKVARELSGAKQIKISSGGIRGVLDEKKSVLIKDLYLTDWVGKPLKERLIQELGCEVYLENDADLVGLGEAVKGAGKGQKIVVYMTLSTGIGGVRIVDGKIDVSAFGFEPGHQIVDLDGTIFPEAVNKNKEWVLGEFESLASGSSIKIRYGKEAREVDDDKVWEEVSSYIAVGLTNTILHWSPSVVVLGGGLMNKVSLEQIKSKLAETLKIFPAHPEIKKAELGDAGGLYGALVKIKQKIE